MKYKESKSVELKRELTKAYLKTVSAFANYDGGEIIFGVSDAGDIVPIKDLKAFCLSIENQINDSVKPKPDYSIKINEEGTITVLVKKGVSTPYCYDKKAYTRNDTSTVEVDSIEYKRLVLRGINLDYEELPSPNQNLTFHVLEEECLSKLKLSTFSTDTLKTLNLYSDENGYNIAALLLSDNNNSPGLDIVIFGSDINEIRQRVTLAGKSLISQYFEALEIFKKQYMFERISNGVREEKEKIPYNAFREALANSLIHRAWDIYANSKVEMYADRIIISSPGGLVEGITKESFLKGSFLVLRNPITANVFLRLRIVEILATGIKRINDAYKDSLSKPSFDVMSSAISIALPLYGDMNLNANERKVIDAMAVNRQYRREEIEDLTSLKKDTLIRVLNSLIKKNQILKTGKAKAVIYSRNA